MLGHMHVRGELRAKPEPTAVASLRGNGWVRTPHFCSDPSWDLRKSVEKCFMYRGEGGPMHVYCNFSLLTSNNKNFGPPLFWAEPEIERGRGLGRGLGEPLPRNFLKIHTRNHTIWCMFDSTSTRTKRRSHEPPTGAVHKVCHSPWGLNKCDSLWQVERELHAAQLMNWSWNRAQHRILSASTAVPKIPNHSGQLLNPFFTHPLQQNNFHQQFPNHWLTL